MRRTIWRGWLALLGVAATLGLVGGCGLGGDGVVEVARPQLEEGLFPLAAAQVVEAGAPERFSVPLPASVEAWREREATLPRAWLEPRLCAGDAEVIERLRRAVMEAAATASPDELRETYGSLLAWCGRPELCSWTRAAVEAGGALGEIAWVGLAQCGGPDNDPLFEAPGVPARERIGYWQQRRWRGDYAPRHVPAMAGALRGAVELGDRYLVRQAALVLGDDGDPRGAAALVALHRELPPGELRDEIAVGLVKSPEPEARAIAAELCGRPGRRDPACRSDDELVQILGPGGKSLIEGAEPLAPAAAPDLERRLREAGLLWRGPLSSEPLLADEEAVAPTSAEELLTRSGPVHCFDTETGTFPNEHDRLLFELAELAGPPLAGALFWEEAPPIDLGDGRFLFDGREVERLPDGAATGMPYRLHAYLDGRSYSVDAQDFGDWYDVDQALGLANAVAADRGAETRLLPLPTGDQTLCVLAAPKGAIVAAIAAGLLKSGRSDAARESGQAFERAIGRMLESGELELPEEE